MYFGSDRIVDFHPVLLLTSISEASGAMGVTVVPTKAEWLKMMVTESISNIDLRRGPTPT